jgi:hypothetical protein
MFRMKMDLDAAVFRAVYPGVILLNLVKVVPGNSQNPPSRSWHAMVDPSGR